MVLKWAIALSLLWTSKMNPSRHSSKQNWLPKALNNFPRFKYWLLIHRLKKTRASVQSCAHHSRQQLLYRMEVSNGALHIYWHDASEGFESWELPSDSNIHALGLSCHEELNFEEGTFSFSTKSPVMVRIPKLKEAFDERNGNSWRFCYRENARARMAVLLFGTTSPISSIVQLRTNMGCWHQICANNASW